MFRNVIIKYQDRQITTCVMKSTRLYQFLEVCDAESNSNNEAIIVNNKIYNKKDHGYKPLGEIVTDYCGIELIRAKCSNCPICYPNTARLN